MARAPLPPPKDWEYVEVRRSGVHGRGLFAARDLPKGTYVMEYRGERVPKKEGTRRTEAQWEKGRVYTFELSRRFDIDGSPSWNLARLANFSCDPNCESQNERGRKVWIVALRDIRKGQEITYDYNFSFVDPPPRCRCGSRRCRGYIVGEAGVPELVAWLRETGKAAEARRIARLGKRPSTPARSGAA
ncbi:MAG TPA: SET domain-containing protein [Candidatus Thermoplasmatota archaeon]|nr:SET domain-containing protein [Candidatus Thermoplasmatota archaeon]